MTFDSTIAATRFGTGLSPVIEPPWDVDGMLVLLSGPDRAAERLPITGMAGTVPSMRDMQQATRARREAAGTPRQEVTTEALRGLNREANAVRGHNIRSTIARGVIAQDGLRERLTLFWADHFTVLAKNSAQRHMLTPFVSDAIRPHVTGRFGDMLKAVVMHPMMILYLDQSRSLGPNSPQGLQAGRGLNENLARELLELHLLGPQGGYGQADVTQMAELLTGLAYDADAGVIYRPRWAEPGAEVVMGRRYAAEAEIGTIHAALDDLALQPATARHIALKLAVHFVAETPDAALVDHIAGAYVASGGDLLAVAAALLEHPASWSHTRAKVRRPDLFVIAALRALGTRADALMALNTGGFGRLIDRPLAAMGQPIERPIGPDGWSEAAATWITPQNLAARITWALQRPGDVVDRLPDPRAFVVTAIGPDAPADLVFAAAAAEKQADGIALVLTSPAFQRI
ncbi:Uncharacterized conserved protein, DUF1800 family [Loktanella fryxellensis]|uniref:Uncharacterized conserved protein, DUF1800 family n=1 Tax=Loktanella fryxellensis TaxID=245187 RepID=A0A1H8ESB2_9RHOB|nr:DUF1800 domain-containing protein [Loktanella fryxellensis]SEN22383.1 Uncharacterized conserved protein, DUF1800 family [Loktanella fryxellensis]